MIYIRRQLGPEFTLVLPTDIILLLIYGCRAGDSSDLGTLRSLPLICKAFSNAITIHRGEIIEYYTVAEVVTPCIYYRFCGQYHRSGDLPAIIRIKGNCEYYQYGQLHRGNDRPAVIWSNGTKLWFQHGMRHRDNDLPAVVHIGGGQEWFQYDQRHREDDKPAIIWGDGSVEWYWYDQKHRDNDLPASIDMDGRQAWHRYGEPYRRNNLPVLIFEDQSYYYENNIYYEASP